MSSRCSRLGSLLLSLGLLGLVKVASGAPVVANPSFEADALTGWPHYNTNITSWTTEAEPGNNTGTNDATGPFHSGLIPQGEKVAFLQNVARLYQNVSGFEAGKKYILTYFENGRDGNTPKGKVTLNGVDIVPEHDITPVGAGNPYAFKVVNFDSPGTGAFELSFASTLTGDNTVLIDLINIAEVGSPANAQPNVTSLDGGVKKVGATKDLTFTLYNNGGSALNVSKLALSGTDANQFSVVSPSGSFSVAVGQSQDVTVRFAPTTEGTKSASLDITSNDPDVVSVALKGLSTNSPVVLNPSFELDAVPGFPGMKSDITNWACAGGTGINDANGPFHSGPIPNGAKVALIQHAGSLTQTVPNFVSGKKYILTYFENGRDSNLPHGQVSVGDTVVVADHEVAPVSGYHFQSATFDSPGDGDFDLKLENLSADGDHTLLYDMVNIAVQGTPGNLLTGVSTEDFGLSTIDQSKDLTFNVYNNGGSALNVSQLAISGTDKGQFSVVSPTGAFSVAVGQSQAVTVRFSPTSKGDKSASLDMTNNGSTTTVSVALTGKGAAGVEVINGSFEADPLPGSPGYAQKITGWTVTGGCGFHDYDSANGGYSTFHDNGANPDGHMVAFIQGSGKFTQSVPGFVKDNLYHVSIWVNRRASTPEADANNPAPFRMTLGGQALFNSSTPLAIMSVAALGDFTVPFIHYEQTFVAPASGNLDMVIEHVSPTGDITLLFDNVTIAQTVNESHHWSVYE